MHHLDLTHTILMTETQEAHPVPENEAAKSASAVEALPPEEEPESPPEPMTPERVSEWNRYYDLYVMAATLLLAFVVSCNYVSDASIFTHLKTGQLINDRTGPLMADEFSYTETGQKWVDVSWLFEWSHAALYNVIYNLVPVDPNDPTANRERAEQIAIGALGILIALTRMAAAWTILKIRHRGPGLWWSAICVTLALGVVFHPLLGIDNPLDGAAMGGIARVPEIGPSSWGLLFFAIELLVLFRAVGKGRSGSLWILIPLFLLWANFDTSFLTGLVILAATAVGRWLDGSNASWLISATEFPSPSRGEDNAEASEATAPQPASAAKLFMILGISAAICLVNPWTYGVYIAAVKPFIQMTQSTPDFQLTELFSFFGAGMSKKLGPNSYLLQVFYLAIVGLGLGSFLINAARFSWSRFLPFAVLAILWAIMIRYSADFAIVFAAVMAPERPGMVSGEVRDRGSARGRCGPSGRPADES